MVANFTSGFSVREPMWHGEGYVPGRYPNGRAEARQWAGLEWEPTIHEIFGLSAANLTPEMAMDPGAPPPYEVIPSYKLLRRSDTGAPLSVVSATYEVVPNETLFDIADAILQAGDAQGDPLKYETAGALDEGRRTWVLINLGDRELPGDPSLHTAFMYVATSHDMTAALRCGATDVRIVCMNTEHLADVDANQRGMAYRFSHTKNIQGRIDEARKAISGAYVQLDQVYERAAELLRARVTAEQTRTFMREFAIQRAIRTCNVKAKDPATLLEDKRILNTVNATVADLEALLQSDTCAGITGTAYSWTQAAVEFLDHIRPSRTTDSHFSRTVLAAEPFKALAHRVADEVLATA